MAINEMLFQQTAAVFPTARVARSRTWATLWRVLFYALRPRRPFVMRTRWYEFNAYPDKRSLTLTRAVIRRGDWEATITELFARLLSVGDLVIDVGANFGHYTMVAANRIGEDGIVIAFEPHPHVFSQLQENAALLPKKNYRLEPLLLGAEAGEITLHASLSNPGGHSVAVANMRLSGEQLTVRMVSLDDFLHASGVDRPVSFIKIDAEGYEGRVIDGAMRTIASHKPVLFLQLTPDQLRNVGDSHERVLRLFDELGYVAIVLRDSEKQRFRCEYEALRRLLSRCAVDLCLIPAERYSRLEPRFKDLVSDGIADKD